jgi:CheY-like chemotaxis protein
MKNRSQHAITSTINIDEKWSHAHLPALALQMTVENCFKHNSLTTENPLLINIETTSDGYVEISNNIQSKISEIEKSVKGIELIQKRYKLMNINEGVRIDREVDSKMRILLVEDETHTAALLKEIIEQKDDCHVVKILETVVDTVFYLSGNQDELDLCFFDIQLADRDSFEIFRHVDVVLPIIFCTSFDEYAMKAIKNNGIDYVLKPFKEEGIQHLISILN